MVFHQNDSNEAETFGMGKLPCTEEEDVVARFAPSEKSLFIDLPSCWPSADASEGWRISAGER